MKGSCKFTMTFFDILFPPRCPYCGALTGRVYESCGECKELLDAEPHMKKLKTGTKCLSVFEYGGAYRTAVLNYKYHGCRQYCKPFAITMSRAISNNLSDMKFDVYTSVPARFDITGSRFDHVKPIARRAAQLCGSRYKSLLSQTHAKEFQHSLGAKERLENVRGLYKVTDTDFVKGKSILLFDDIVTTGATLNACSEVLLKSGAKSVFCITLEW